MAEPLTLSFTGSVYSTVIECPNLGILRYQYYAMSEDHLTEYRV